ncbi:hypothetical protein [Prolixibacter denitrificans]|uniref:Uncharacterized protein n=1 Tax=Prolixibacter denitrificans TaxID=1541063 RepID=A0A2P8CH16_9BACT|nr:hypothetical protein [Prolixibacter denitrificans]PSK84277.1 hypothetical protein CLV93_10261 [Prolixibacter denitrificans]GET20452.1 hypothetical protein JCM18694_06980 [Prolixibacter denitrificans]
MNKLYKFLIIIAVALAGCNPMEDINNQLDQQKEAPTAEFEYTLSDADYSSISSYALENASSHQDSAIADAIAEDLALPEGFAADYIPALMSELHPALGKNSVAKVSYNFTNGPKAYLYDIKSAPEYGVSDDDYMQFGGAVAEFKYFSPSNPPEDYLPTILNNGVSGASSGDIRLVTYEYSDTDPDYTGEEGVVAFTMSSSDYELLVNYVMNDPDLSSYMDPNYDNSEYYYGASYYYNNFDIRISKRADYPEFAGLTDAEANALIASRLKEGLIKMLQLKFGAKAIEGMKYEVTYKTYDGTTSETPTATFICTAAGDTPTFSENMEVLTMEKADYELLVNYVKNDPTLSAYMDPDYDNSEYYYGASYYYDNFDLRLSNRTGYAEFSGLSDADAEALIQERLTEGLIKFLELKIGADAVVDKQYSVTYKTYDGSSSATPTRVFVCTSAGTNPVFEEVLSTKNASLKAASTIYGRGDYYKYNGSSWVAMTNVVYLSDADYDAMGEPGAYNNFSSSAPANDYLPQFMAQKYPYAQENDTMAVVYKYYSGGVRIYADEYDFISGTWSLYNPVEVKTDQFINIGSKWIFDPTVKFTMSSSDFQLIVDAVKANSDTKNLVDSYGTGEFYYGANSFYNNFDLRIVKRNSGEFAQSEYDGLSDEEASTLIMDRVVEGIVVMLKAKFPNAVAQVSGVDVMYVISFNSYENDGSYGKYTVTLQCTKSGPDPSFELVEGPTPVE